eukprot:3598237-Rhodomonas_salina.2
MIAMLLPAIPSHPPIPSSIPCTSVTRNPARTTGPRDPIVLLPPLPASRAKTDPQPTPQPARISGAGCRIPSHGLGRGVF